MYKGFPREHWKRIRTTDLSERINKEIKRRSRVVGTFPNDDSFLKLAVSILMDINEKWITGMNYLTFDDLEGSKNRRLELEMQDQIYIKYLTQPKGKLNCENNY